MELINIPTDTSRDCAICSSRLRFEPFAVRDLTCYISGIGDINPAAEFFDGNPPNFRNGLNVLADAHSEMLLSNRYLYNIMEF